MLEPAARRFEHTGESIVLRMIETSSPTASIRDYRTKTSTSLMAASPEHAGVYVSRIRSCEM
jgi:hypothetical protein